MFLDASAIIAGESDAANLAARLGQAPRVLVSPVAIYEAALGLARIGNTSIAEATSALDRFPAEVEATVVPIDAACGQGALAAVVRFGDGRHAAALSLGDCFAYASATQHGAALLCKGEDFARTDIVLA